MPERIELRGMTWDHSRGFDPMVATSERFGKTHPGVSITWERRSLQAFADRPIKDMASDYDLMVIDHPHVGEVARGSELLPLDSLGHDAELGRLASRSVGASHRSYEFDGRQWALAIDAATPVAAFRSDIIENAPSEWAEVVELARKGQVAFALIPLNSLMTFMGLAKNIGIEIAAGEDRFIDKADGTRILDLMKEIVALLDPECLKLDPIGVYDWMGSSADGPAYSPFGYGYSNYSRDGYCKFPLTFADAPGVDGAGPRGTVIGGTGIAISASCKNPTVAADYAFWIAGSECQKDLYFRSGGQPGHADAWESDECNAETRNFFRNTRETLETAWLRPRHDGYMEFQDKGGDIVHACLRNEVSVSETLERLEASYLGTKR